MKKNCLVLILLTFLFAGSVDALDAASETQVKKIYIQPNQITLKENQIWVQVDMQWLQVSNLNTDARGVYISANNDLPLGFWECDRCGAINYPWNFVCSTCGNSR